MTDSTVLETTLDVRVVVFGLRDGRLQVLLSSATADTTAETWRLPGSPMIADQSLEDTATQKVLQLTSLREVFLEQLYTYGDATRCNPGRLVSVIYFAITPVKGSQAHSDSASIYKDDAKSQWFPVDQLPPLALDFAEIVAYAWRRLRYKLEYSAVGFQLLPEYFSLSELQSTYEIILGEKLDKRNFRRRILQAGIIEETTHLRGGEGRPARLYRYQPDAVAEVKARRLFP